MNVDRGHVYAELISGDMTRACVGSAWPAAVLALTRGYGSSGGIVPDGVSRTQGVIDDIARGMAFASIPSGSYNIVQVVPGGQPPAGWRLFRQRPGLVFAVPPGGDPAVPTQRQYVGTTAGFSPLAVRRATMTTPNFPIGDKVVWNADLPELYRVTAQEARRYLELEADVARGGFDGERNGRLLQQVERLLSQKLVAGANHSLRGAALGRLLNPMIEWAGTSHRIELFPEGSSHLTKEGKSIWRLPASDFRSAFEAAERVYFNGSTPPPGRTRSQDDGKPGHEGLTPGQRRFREQRATSGAERDEAAGILRRHRDWTAAQALASAQDSRLGSANDGGGRGGVRRSGAIGAAGEEPDGSSLGLEGRMGRLLGRFPELQAALRRNPRTLQSLAEHPQAADTVMQVLHDLNATGPRAGRPVATQNAVRPYTAVMLRNPPQQRACGRAPPGTGAAEKMRQDGRAPAVPARAGDPRSTDEGVVRYMSGQVTEETHGPGDAICAVAEAGIECPGAVP
jgi:hypothetical protein